MYWKTNVAIVVVIKHEMTKGSDLFEIQSPTLFEMLSTHYSSNGDLSHFFCLIF